MSVLNSGCGGCRWTVQTYCVRDTGKSGPSQDHCGGTFVGCTGTAQRFVVSLQTPTEPLHVVDRYCYVAVDGGVVSAATVALDVRRYATQLAVATPTIASYPPQDVTLVNLPTYFQASAAGSGQRTVGGQGYQLTLQVAPDRYDWSYGDGATASTTDAGGPPPTGDVQHTYQAPGTVQVALSVGYGATYTVVTPFGSFGPTAVDGGEVRTLPATLALQVRTAAAGLTQ